MKDDHYASLIPQGWSLAMDRHSLMVTHPVKRQARETGGNQCNCFLSFVLFFSLDRLHLPYYITLKASLEAILTNFGSNIHCIPS